MEGVDGVIWWWRYAAAGECGPAVGERWGWRLVGKGLVGSAEPCFPGAVRAGACWVLHTAMARVGPPGKGGGGIGDMGLAASASADARAGPCWVVGTAAGVVGPPGKGGGGIGDMGSAACAEPWSTADAREGACWVMGTAVGGVWPPGNGGRGSSRSWRRPCWERPRAAALAGHVPPTPLRTATPTCTLLSHHGRPLHINRVHFKTHWPMSIQIGRRVPPIPFRIPTPPVRCSPIMTAHCTSTSLTVLQKESDMNRAKKNPGKKILPDSF